MHFIFLFVVIILILCFFVFVFVSVSVNANRLSCCDWTAVCCFRSSITIVLTSVTCVYVTKNCIVGRNWCRCDQCGYAGKWCGQHQTPPVKDTRLISGDWFVEGVLEELDIPGV